MFTKFNFVDFETNSTKKLLISESLLQKLLIKFDALNFIEISVCVSSKVLLFIRNDNISS